MPDGAWLSSPVLVWSQQANVNLKGGVTRSLAPGAHGKSLSSAMLSLELPDR